MNSVKVSNGTAAVFLGVKGQPTPVGAGAIHIAFGFVERDAMTGQEENYVATFSQERGLCGWTGTHAEFKQQFQTLKK